jgi:hypothetical protein
MQIYDAHGTHVLQIPHMDVEERLDAVLTALKIPSIVTSGCCAKSSAPESHATSGSRSLKRAKPVDRVGGFSENIPLRETRRFVQTPSKAGAFLSGMRWSV